MFKLLTTQKPKIVLKNYLLQAIEHSIIPNINNVIHFGKDM